MNEPAADEMLKGKTVVTADHVELGVVEADTPSHLGVRTFGHDVPGGQLWLPKAMVASVAGDRVELNRIRADLHDAVLALPPGQQREFASLGLSVKIGRMRGLGHGAR